MFPSSLEKWSSHGRRTLKRPGSICYVVAEEKKKVTQKDTRSASLKERFH